ncbi:MAG: hypothetical protein H6R18_888 [Proteobacteria bacterium]|nr:hypothetical protein [Pseudomonadota bacterium]
MNAITASQIYLGRQPILDRNQNLFAYELLFRNSARNAARIPDSSTATATVIANAFSEISIGDALGDCRGFINVEVEFLFSDMLLLLPPSSVVLEILETVPMTADVMARCRELKEKGFVLAMDDFLEITSEHQELVSLVDYIKVNTQRPTPDELERLVKRLRPLGKALVAEKVDSKARMEQCMALDFDYFQGYHFARPTVIAGKKANHSQLALMRLMSLLLSDAETSELEAAFKPEPVLTVNLLRMTNSAGAGTTVRITSLRHAITILGRRQLQRWLQLLLFASGTHSGTTSPLLHLAATRGRLMELLAGAQKKGNISYADGAFMVGIMSLMPALMGMPIEEIVAPLGITSEVRDALCQGSGALGSLLKLIAATESDAPEETESALQECHGLDAGTLNQCQAQALAWANSINREAEH